MWKYLVIYEKSADGFSAYVPDLPGCTSAERLKKKSKRILLKPLNSIWK
jgi:hypothetical protein